MTPRYFKRLLFTVCFALLTTCSIAQQDHKGVFFWEPEVMTGKIAPNYPGYPESSLRKNLALSFGRQQNTLDKSWAKYYNFPSTGVTVSISELGNPSVFGQEYSVLPFVVFNTAKSHHKSWYLKLGLGASYYSKSFASNPENEAIGSEFTWAFQSFIYKNIRSTPSMNLKIGAGFLHGSNAHAKLPNFGLNSAMISLSAQWFRQKVDPEYAMKNTPAIDRDKHYFMQVRTGLGYHEFGGTRIPIGGKTRPVHTISIAGGIVYRNHIKIRAGLAYRYYSHYYEDIMRTENPEYIDHPRWSSSNLFWYLGSEFLLGHVGLNFEGGMNIYKPYYKVYFDRYGTGSGLKEFLKKTFNSKLGLNFYLKNTNRNPKHNVFIGTNVSTNFGQADFGEIGLGYVMRIK